MARVIRQQELRSNVPAPAWGDPKACLDSLNFHPRPIDHGNMSELNVVFVRTTPENEIRLENGLIVVGRDFHEGRAQGSHIGAQVVAVHPNSPFAVGEQIVFERLDFAWTHRLPDGSLVGWVREIHVYFTIDEDSTASPEATVARAAA